MLLAQRNETADQDKCVKMQTKIEEVEAILLNKNQENQRLLEELNLEKHRLETLKETTNRYEYCFSALALYAKLFYAIINEFTLRLEKTSSPNY